MRSDFYSLPWAAQQAIRKGERASHDARRQSYTMAELNAKNADLARDNIAKDKEIEALREALVDALSNIEAYWKPHNPRSFEAHYVATTLIDAALKREVPGV